MYFCYHKPLLWHLVVSSEEMMKKFVSWDTEKRLSFAVPFKDMKPVIFLDPFLPRISELALSTSDRQTKVSPLTAVFEHGKILHPCCSPIHPSEWECV